MSGEMIHTLLGEIMSEVPAIPKEQRNQQQGYAFRGIDDVMDDLHGLFAVRGVYVRPEVIASDYLQQPLGANKNLATDARITVRYHFTAPEGSTTPMTVIGESRDYADKATNQAMSAGYKTGLLQMFLIPLVETRDADAASPIGTVEVSEDEIEERQSNAAKTEIVEVLGSVEAAAVFWETHQSLAPEDLITEAKKEAASDDD